MTSLAEIAELFGSKPEDARFLAYLEAHQLGSLSQHPKVLSPSVFFDYPSSGVSFCFECIEHVKLPSGAAFADLDLNKLVLVSVDLYHKPDPALATGESRRIKSQGSTTFSTCEVCLPLEVAKQDKSLSITTTTTPKDMVEALGEPNKGGGQRSPIWLEWVRFYDHLGTTRVLTTEDHLYLVTSPSWASRST